MPRGITQDQVNAAADAILGSGGNPTVEKVRAELGTGSPNTITRMLDTWRRGLGERLRQLTTLPDLPVPVGQAMTELWRMATEHARRDVEGHLAEERARVQAAQAELNAERDGWEARLQAAADEVTRANAARVLVEQHRAALEEQLREDQRLRGDLIDQRDRLQALHDDQVIELKQLREQLDQRTAALQEEQSRRETYVQKVEDRAHQEVDRARLEARQWQDRYEACERARSDEVASLQRTVDSLRQAGHKAEQALARQTGRVEALQKTLERARSLSAKAEKAKPKRGTTSKRSPARKTQRTRKTTEE